MALKVLIIAPIPGPIQALLKGVEGIEIASDPSGVDRVRTDSTDIVVLDAEMPTAFATLETLKAIKPEPEVILVAKAAKVEDAVRAIKLGAGDYVSTSGGPAQLILAVDRARRVRMLIRENLQLRQELRDRGSERQIIGRTAAMERVHDVIDRVCKADGPALIAGEPGTGKELVARAIHADSGRSAEPFVRVRVEGARPEDAEREFGSAMSRVGSGTLFFHEVAALSPELQEVLALRPPPKARILASSSRNLIDLVGRGLFRQDLFDLFSRSIITVPALRERRDDIPLLVQAILQRRTARGQRSAKGVSPEALTTMLRHTWPGNVGELEQAIERACELGDGGYVERRHLPPSVIQSAEAGRTGRPSETATVATQSLKEMESEIIRRMLVEQQGNTESVSRLLKIDRSTLYRKIKRYGIDLGLLKDGPE